MAELAAMSNRGATAPVLDFAVWVKAEQPRIFLLCRRMLRDGEEADAATQDVFWKAFKALQNREEGVISDPGRWLTRIAVNTCLDRLRSRRWQFWRKRLEPSEEAWILTMSAVQEPNAEDQIFAAEIERSLAQALSRLSDRQRAVFTLKHYENRTLEEIAEILELDAGTVKAHMSRAVAKLREDLKDLYQAVAKRRTI
ncbi:MAG: RNA polymerase sigma factor [Bryobacteraceae bacterium]|nr:RNA polymerase sigma factor [Bryobacteraceae bacterium]MDW8379822.1 RNA polymerase sigma factor [Bryobacterales bacterium]